MSALPPFIASNLMDPPGRNTRFWLPLLMGLCAVSGVFSLQAQVMGEYDDPVVADVGDYSYNGYQYDPLTVGDAIDIAFDSANGAIGTIGEATSFINRSTSFGAWRVFNDGTGFVGAQGGLNLIAQRPVLFRGSSRPDQLRGIRFGPFYLTNIYAGAGVLYSEYSGTPIRGARFRDSDDPWAAIIWASAEVSTYIHNTFAFSFRPYVYYLPLEGKVGFSAVSSLFGFNGGMVPRSMLQMAYRVPLGNNWELNFYDRLDAVLAQNSIFEESLFYSAQARDLSAYDAAGRYGFGGFGVPIIDATGRGNIDLNDRLFEEDRLIFRNIAGVNLYGRLADTIYANAFYERYDLWNNDFEHRSGWNTGGITLVQEHPFLSKYVGYRISGSDNTETIQWAFAGVRAVLGPRITADARVGYMWRDGPVNGRDSWIGQLLVDHQIGPYTWHGLSMGRTVTEHDFGSRYLADYVRYYLSHSLSSNAEFRLFAQLTDAERLNRNGSSYSSVAVGALLTMQLTPADSISFMNSFETFDLQDNNRDWELWTHRLAYIRRLSADSSAQFFYQFQHGDSSSVLGNDFMEHVVYLGIIKQF